MGLQSAGLPKMGDRSSPTTKPPIFGGGGDTGGGEEGGGERGQAGDDWTGFAGGRVVGSPGGGGGCPLPNGGPRASPGPPPGPALGGGRHWGHPLPLSGFPQGFVLTE